LKKGIKLSKFEKKCDEGFLLGYSTSSKVYRVYNKTYGIVEEVHDVEFDESNGSQDDVENLDDVRGTQLVNAMKNMDIGDIRPREVIDIEDDKDQVLPPQIVQVNDDQASGSPTPTHDQDQVQQAHDQQASTSQPNQQVQYQPSTSNQVLHPVHIARDHPLDLVVGDIRSGVQTRSRLASFCEHVTPSFKEQNQVSHMCAQEVHIYVRMKKYQK
jgi:hypothetical protein